MLKVLQSDDTLHVLNVPVVASRGELLLMYLKYSIVHQLTHTAMTNLFKAVNCMFARSILPDTRYMVDKLFFSSHFVNYHAICPYCGAYASTFVRSNRQRECPICTKVFLLRSINFKSFYVTFNIKNSIKELLEQHDEYYDNILRRVHEPGVYKDIYDGKAYRDFVLSLDQDVRTRYLTFIFNSDGAVKFESSPVSAYPVYVILNELPIDVRNSNPIVCALWFGRGKPDMNVFLEAFVKEMNELTKTKIICNIRGERRSITPFAICCCVDSVARPPMQGITQFNGKYGCSWCLHKGEWISNAQNTGGCIKFPILDAMPAERNEGHMLQCMQLLFHPVNHLNPVILENSASPSNTATLSNTTTVSDSAAPSNPSMHPDPANPSNSDDDTCGVQHASPLINLQKFNIVSGFVPDDMHFARLGIAKQFAGYWFDSKISPLLRTLTAKDLKEIDAFLDNIKVPHKAMRLTRSISDKAYWKAKEWENWTLYFSLPILELYLDKKLLLHWALFVEASHISLQTSITRVELKRLEKLVKEFMIYTEEYYTKSAMTYNVHQLLHWVNRNVLDMIKSAKGEVHQVCRQLSMRNCDSILKNCIFPQASAHVKQFYLNLTEKTKQKSCKIKAVRYFGVGRKAEEQWIEHLQLSRETVSYHRMIKDKCIYSSVNNMEQRSNNSYAKLIDVCFVKIEKYLVDPLLVKEYTICRDLITQNAYGNLGEPIKKVNCSSNNLRAVDTGEIEKICIFMKIKNTEYVLSVSNMYDY